MKLEKLEEDNYYHIYNRGINSAKIFTSDENKEYFLRLVNKYLTDKVGIFAYCLMDNHCHFAVKILSDEKSVLQAFSNLFNAYAKAFNKRNKRTGSLFEKHFKRIKVKDENYLRNLIIYIHINPQIHGVVSDFSLYKHSSYPYYLDNTMETVPFAMDKNEIIHLFGDVDNLVFVHKGKVGTDLQGFENLPSHENLAGHERPYSYQDLASQEKTFDLRNMPSVDYPNSKHHQALNTTSNEKTIMEIKEESHMKDLFYKYIVELQNRICSKLEEIDGQAKFREDLWERPEGGGGRTRVIENGGVFEKGGVNISAVHGALPESMQAYFGVKDANFFACGLSLVLHPKNPMVPTVHANWRYFEMYDKEGNKVDQWFGGGQDLTPYYLFDEDAIHFHAICKQACDSHHPEFYTQYKKKCDDYFWNTHRKEARGIGGLFFDYCRPTEEMSITDWYNFVTEVGNSFLQSYIPIVINRKDLNFNTNHRTWQEIRRGRYVEFNLVHDKGTLFGLKTNGRIESILMSLPPHVQWVYDHHPEPGSEEEQLVQVLRNPKDWIL